MVIPLNLNLVTGTTKTKVMGAAYIPVQSKQLEFFIKIIAECESLSLKAFVWFNTL